MCPYKCHIGLSAMHWWNRCSYLNAYSMKFYFAAMYASRHDSWFSGRENYHSIQLIMCILNVHWYIGVVYIKYYVAAGNFGSLDHQNAIYISETNPGNRLSKSQHLSTYSYVGGLRIYYTEVV